MKMIQLSDNQKVTIPYYTGYCSILQGKIHIAPYRYGLSSYIRFIFGSVHSFAVMSFLSLAECADLSNDQSFILPPIAACVLCIVFVLLSIHVYCSTVLSARTTT